NCDDQKKDVHVAIDAGVRRRDAFLQRHVSVRKAFEMRRLLDAVVTGGREVVAIHDLVAVEAEVTRVLTDEAPREDRRRQRAVIVAFDGLEKSLADLGGISDFLERDAADLPLAAELLAERRELRVRLLRLLRHRGAI